MSALLVNEATLMVVFHDVEDYENFVSNYYAPAAHIYPDGRIVPHTPEVLICGHLVAKGSILSISDPAMIGPLRKEAERVIKEGARE